MADDATPEVLDEITEMDVRYVYVVWSGDEPFPEVTWGGGSAYEAIGFLLAAADKLRDDFRLPRVSEDDLDDDD